MPHGLSFAAIAQQFNLRYCQPKQLEQFIGEYQTALAEHHTLIEVCTSNNSNQLSLQQLKEQIEYATF